MCVCLLCLYHSTIRLQLYYVTETKLPNVFFVILFLWSADFDDLRIFSLAM